MKTLKNITLTVLTSIAFMGNTNSMGMSYPLQALVINSADTTYDIVEAVRHDIPREEKNKALD